IVQHLSEEQRAEIKAHVRSLQPETVVVMNSANYADIRNWEYPHERPGVAALHPSTTDASVTFRAEADPQWVDCDQKTNGWWVFDDSLDPASCGWTRDFALSARDALNGRNSTLGVNVPVGPSGSLSPRSE